MPYLEGGNEGLRNVVREVIKPLILECEVFRSVDHVARVLDSVLYDLKSRGLLSEESVELVIKEAGEKFAPYVLMLNEHRDEVLSERVRYPNLVKFFSVIERYAEVYGADKFGAPLKSAEGGEGLHEGVGASLVNVREYHAGLSHSSNYYFIIEGGELVHISRYSTSQVRVYDSVEYSVNINMLRGKKVVKVMSSNSGLFCHADVFPAERLGSSWSDRVARQVPLSFLNDLKFTHLTPHEARFLSGDWRKYYVLMINDLRDLLSLLKRLNPSHPYVSLPNLIRCQLESGAKYPLSFLIPYSEVSRRKSLEGLTKQIHQLWVLTKILTKLYKTNRLVADSLRLDFRQASYNSVASYLCADGLCSIWYEFDMNPHTMCEGMLWYSKASRSLKNFYERISMIKRRRGLKRVPLRPDIAILKGGRDCRELSEGFRVKSIIECKNWDYNYWAGEVDTQILPYKEIFKPDTLILASLKEVPESAKERLRALGINVIDNVHPLGGGINELLGQIK